MLGRITRGLLTATFSPVLVILICAVWGLPVRAQSGNPSNESLTCHVTDNAFVMEDSDFKALAHPSAQGENPPLTPQFFRSLKLTSVLRQQICDSRGFLRAMRKIGGNHCTMKLVKSFPRYSPELFGDDEQEILEDCLISAATE